jgi:Tat protein translocase TatB subunit
MDVLLRKLYRLYKRFAAMDTALNVRRFGTGLHLRYTPLLLKNIDKTNNQYIGNNSLLKEHNFMFGIGWQELLIIAIVALLIVGPKKLPDLAKSLGKGFREFKSATEGVTEDLKDALKEDEKPKADDGLKDSLLVKKTDAEQAKSDDSGDSGKKQNPA